MTKSAQRKTILMADDDGEDCALVGDAVRETGRPYHVHFVRNGEEVFRYLRHEGEYSEGREAPEPDLILLDLKMPRKDGRETLRELKTDPHWRATPVVVLTSSAAGADVTFCYDMGVNAYVTKPATYRELVRIVTAITHYWFEVAELPPKVRHGRNSH